MKGKAITRQTWFTSSTSFDFISQLSLETCFHKLEVYKRREDDDYRANLAKISSPLIDVALSRINQNMYSFVIVEHTYERKGMPYTVEISGYLDRFDESQTHIWGEIKRPRGILLLSFLMLIFVILIIFSNYFWISLGLFILSMATIAVLMQPTPLVNAKLSFLRKLFQYHGEMADTKE